MYTKYNSPAGDPAFESLMRGPKAREDNPWCDKFHAGKELPLFGAGAAANGFAQRISSSSTASNFV